MFAVGELFARNSRPSRDCIGRLTTPFSAQSMAGVCGLLLESELCEFCELFPVARGSPAAIPTDAPKRGPLPRSPAFEVEACAPVLVVAFDPTTEHAGIDLAALSRNLFESVMQSAKLRAPGTRMRPARLMRSATRQSPSMTAAAASRKAAKFLSFGLLLLGGLDAGRGVAEFSNTFFGDPQDALANEIVPVLERGQPILGEAWFARGDEPAQEREPGSRQGRDDARGSIAAVQARRTGVPEHRFPASIRAVRMRR